MAEQPAPGGTEATGNGPAAEFEEYRPLLLGLAYRLLGSMWDAEDVVQDAWLRWTRTERATVREVRPFLVTVVSRLALDHLRSARARREIYTGPWLPEPVPAGVLGPMDTAELRDTVSYATVHLLERLTPPERAVFVLREAFGLPYDDIARTLRITAANCRQLCHRARERMAEGRDRFRAAPEEYARLADGFLRAARSGDLASLAGLLSEDVTAWSDGGGKVRAALRPIQGRDRVLAFLGGLLTRYRLTGVETVESNGEPALWMTAEGRGRLVTFGIREGRIHRVYGVLNPDKLARVDPAVT
ncbi:sigma-70 family RNA polymerase sigma factor [Streptomyces sodiiphilus]|uniref:Sigma-70 family RNA polymerase sigma factor n=1 Tax=Streptomyces sodiiphilus TaxID=226217 RepID=A0ABN2PT55_9ACTN